ncbi:unnamed protein product [Peniophora sp. CBMAI 1063]|nr:unnamed protein product [Peniophora sp. CBMAI 1063]
MSAFQTHPSAFHLPRYSAPDVSISPPDANIDAAFAIRAQSQGFQHYGRLEIEDLTRLFKALLERRGDDSVKARAFTLFGSQPVDGWEQSFSTAFIGASDDTVRKICRMLKDDGGLRDAHARVQEVLSAQARLQVPTIDLSP